MKYPYPVMYQNVYCYDEMKRAEHMAVRETVGWYLWTHQIPWWLDLVRKILRPCPRN